MVMRLVREPGRVSLPFHPLTQDTPPHLHLLHRLYLPPPKQAIPPGPVSVPGRHVSCDTSSRISCDGWFGLTGPRNHFATSISQRARSCPTLLDALLALSARHFSTLPSHHKLHILQTYGLPQHRHSLEIAEETVLHYHNRCITELRRID
ncbi:uncharacterized protein BDV17DRAFT_185364 [Aspergillus undulatus]|uniref:uncharacterized protein n=1 Tax=Aspergillus undulatus TaxID=1810928 RepID=UPI003CCD41A5